LKELPGTRDEPSGIGAMALAGGFLAVFSLLMSRVFPDLPWSLLFPVLLGGGLGWTRGLLDGSAVRGLFGLALGGGAGLLVSSGLVSNALVACGVFGGLLGTYHALDERGPRLILSAVLTTGLLAAIGAAFGSLLLAAPALPSLVSVGLAGTVFGTAVGSSQALRLRPRDLVVRRYQRLRDGVRGELSQMLEALMREFVKLDRFLRGTSHLQAQERRRLLRQVTTLTHRVLETAGQASELEQELLRVRPADIEQRSGEVRRRLESAADDSARREYAQALANLDEQTRHVRQLEGSRERLMSRLTNFLTAMQSLYLSLVNLEVAGREGDAELDGPPGTALQALGGEVDALRQLAEELSLRQRLEQLPDEVRSLRGSE
jgi:hypothetical protein